MRIIEKSQYSIENVQEQQFSLILSRKAISVSELFLKNTTFKRELDGAAYVFTPRLVQECDQKRDQA